jgi:4-amino-4-deoxy-L-arabinose transferase-like glycosyltransferase
MSVVSDAASRSNPSGSGHLREAVGLAALIVMLLTVTAPQISLTWDEPTYMVAARNHMEWFGTLLTHPSSALSGEGVRESWEFNSEHPPLSKVWSGLVWLVARHVFDDLTAHRLGNMLLAGLLVALLYLLLAPHYGRIAALAAVAALMTMPRFFFHAHLAALDVPVSAMILAVIFVFWRTRHRPGVRWSLLLGVVWGLAIATKINGLLIPPITLLLWTLVFERKAFLLGRLLIMGVVGPAVCLALWPWMYYSTLERLGRFLEFMTVNHTVVEQVYFNEMMTPPPWHFLIVMLIAVVPSTLLVLGGLGAWQVSRTPVERPLGGLLALAGLISVGVLTSGRGQIFDNERLMMPVFPFLAALAGIGFALALTYVRQAAQHQGTLSRTRTWTAAFVAAVFLPHTFTALLLYPYLLSFYSMSLGGIWGARLLRMETTYWCETYRSALRYVNEHAPPGGSVWAECHDVLRYYQRQGELRRDLKIGSDSEGSYSAFEGEEAYHIPLEEADVTVIQYRQSGFYRPIRAQMERQPPVYRLTRLGVPLLAIYQSAGTSGDSGARQSP